MNIRCYSKTLIALNIRCYSKTFDSIEHSLLFKKLHSLGVSRKAVDWFKSYLSDKSQSVRIGHILSEGRVITHGIPQGSILGPALFSIYINDLPTTPIACPLESYVDDAKIYLSFSFKDINVAEIQLTDDLRRIAAWCCSNSLLANPEKTKLLLFGTPQMLIHVQNFRVTFLDKELQPVFSARDLGVEFDGCLSYDEHIIQVVSKCTKSLCLINRVKHILETTRQYDHITPVLQQLKWLPVSYTLRYKDAVMAFKCLKGLAPPYVTRRFTSRSQTHDRVTRQMDELDIPFYHILVPLSGR